MNPESRSLPALETLRPIEGHRVLVRADLNVPLRAIGNNAYAIGDDFKLRASLPTLEWLLHHGADVVVCSHLGRPHGKLDPRYSMAPVRKAMATLCPDVEVMENLRFDPGEESNDPDFTRRLVEGFDDYVNDAFGACHRSHASIVGPPALLPSAAGRLMSQEVSALERLLAHPAHPYVAVIGGAKVADKLGMLRSLAEQVDELLLGGAMCFTFLAALGLNVGASRVEPQLIADARALLDSHSNIVLPTDFQALSPGVDISSGSGTTCIVGNEIPDGWQGVDIGPESRQRFANSLVAAETILWNGPMGVFEQDRFAAGTRAIAGAVASCAGFSVVGGGDTAAALHEYGLEDRIGHVSSGGGATLELLQYGDLPGLAALRAGRRR